MQHISGEALLGLLVPQESPMWSLLVGANVEHTVHGTGSITRVESRGTYTPLIHIAFTTGDARIPLARFSSGRFTLSVPDTALSKLVAESETIAAIKQQQELLETQQRELEEKRRKELEERRYEEIERLQRAHEERLAEEARELQERKMALRETLPERHRQRLEGLGLNYRGIRKVSTVRHRRITRCWSCHGPLDNDIDVECVACGWILCTCGACGCGYDSPSV